MFWLLVVGAVSAISAYLFYIYFIRPFTYWKERGVIQGSTFEIWVGTARLILQLNGQAEVTSEIYNNCKGLRYIGIYSFSTPILYLRDPDLIQQVTVKDFDHFVDRNQSMPEETEPLMGKNLVGLTGDRWRNMRSILSPSFTSSKMKSMFVLMTECAEQFVEYFKNHDASHGVEMRDAFTRFANDVIASTAFGIKCDSLTDRNNELYLMGKEATSSAGLWNNLKFIAITNFPRVAKFFGINMFSDRFCEFSRRLVKTNIESREKHGIVRSDMIQLLLDARNGQIKREEQNDIVDSSFAVVEESLVRKQHETLQKPLTDDDITAQALIFFFAGLESASSLMCFSIYEIAVNPDVQETLRKEVEETLEECSGHITYDALIKMKYMDMVVSETLRKWPPTTAVDRLCVKPYTIQPVTKTGIPLHLHAGSVLWIPIFGIHRYPEYYPNPDRFDPERFSDENKANIKPCTFMPFGSGPRSCIANRFALLETKTILFYLLSNFDITVTEKTSIPLELRKDQFNIGSQNGFWVGLKPRSA